MGVDPDADDFAVEVLARWEADFEQLDALPGGDVCSSEQAPPCRGDAREQVLETALDRNADDGERGDVDEMNGHVPASAVTMWAIPIGGEHGDSIACAAR